MNEISGAATSTPAIAIALVVLTGLAFVLRSCLGTKAPAKKTDPWACGYEPNEHMPVVATSFASDVELFMGPLYTLREDMHQDLLVHRARVPEAHRCRPGR